MAKTEHFAQATTTGAGELFARPVLNDRAALETMNYDATQQGTVAIVIDITASAAQLLLTVAAQRSPIAYVAGAADASSSRPLRRLNQDRSA